MTQRWGKATNKKALQLLPAFKTAAADTKKSRSPDTWGGERPSSSLPYSSRRNSGLLRRIQSVVWPYRLSVVIGPGPGDGCGGGCSTRRRGPSSAPTAWTASRSRRGCPSGDGGSSMGRGDPGAGGNPRPSSGRTSGGDGDGEAGPGHEANPTPPLRTAPAQGNPMGTNEDQKSAGRAFKSH